MELFTAITLLLGFVRWLGQPLFGFRFLSKHNLSYNSCLKFLILDFEYYIFHPSLSHDNVPKYKNKNRCHKIRRTYTPGGIINHVLLLYLSLLS